MSAFEEKVTSMFGELSRSIENLSVRMDGRFDTVDQRLDTVDQRLDAMDQRFDAMDRRFESVDSRFESVDQRFTSVDQRMDSLENKIDDLRDDMKIEFRVVRVEMEHESKEIRNLITGVDNRVGNLESLSTLRWNIPEITDRLDSVETVVAKHSGQIGRLEERYDSVASS